jgi:large subunit ribosomal protein L17
MRHHKKGKKLGREKNQRKALLKALAVALLNNKAIKTTETKAKALRPFVEKVITNAKKNDLSAKRLTAAAVGNGKAHENLFKVIIPMVAQRKGGYTRIIKLPRRLTDGSPMAIIEIVQ